MKSLTSIVAAGCTALATFVHLPLHAQAWPARPVQVIVPGAPGDGADLAGRLLGQKLQEKLGQSFVIDNKTGAGGIIGSVAGKNAAPDGYHFIIGTAGSHGINAAVYDKLAYDPIKDFEPVILINKTPNVCVIHPSIPASNLAEFVALAKKEPGKYSFASGGNGSSAHLSGEYLKMLAGIDLLHVPYKGATPAVQAVIAGQVQMFCGNLPPAIPHIKAGKLRALGVTTLKRSPELPDVPTIDESGYKGFESVAWFAFFAPKGTPADAIGKLNQALDEIIRMPDVREKLQAQGTEPVGGSPADLKQFQAAEIEKWTKVARTAKVAL
ncbi:MAG: tripartite tricarboxylate transporter substrate binding protein [Rhodoferax sp.]|nr:tripartite tricarboxylate transporter substrate binding protein [Rhodoferax sp.]MCW5629718.1 tripartite tricarboxylate transporter substrate binding protein [Rhodoferax sp.]MCW5645170.1 tripartite tricarboxylate transporter substrate binding protein [Rhodoferax sp.]